MILRLRKTFTPQKGDTLFRIRIEFIVMKINTHRQDRITVNELNALKFEKRKKN